MCKMKKVTIFTQFEQKVTHISRCKLVYKYTITSVSVHNFTFAHFFFLSSPCTMNSVTSPFLIFFFLRCTQTHPHTNTSTNPQRQTNREIDRCSWNDRCLIGACGSCLNGACESCLIGAWPRGSRDWVLFEEWVWVLLVLQWRCLIFILNERGREGARESEGFEMAVKLSMEIWPKGCGLDREGEVICVQKWV